MNGLGQRWTRRLGFLVAAFAMASAAYAQVTVTKVVTDATGNVLSPTTVVAPGTALKYRVTTKYTGTSYLPASTLVDSMTLGQQYLPGSLKLPFDWIAPNPVFSSANVSALTTSPIFPGGTIGKVVPLSGLSTAVATASSGGDGFVPIVYEAGGKIFQLFHHSAPGSGLNKINCVTLAAGVACPGYPKSIAASATSGAPALATPNINPAYQVGAKLYFAAHNVGTNSTGLGCWDMGADIPCAFIDLQAPPGVDSGTSRYGQFSITQVPSKPHQFILASGGNLYCADVTANGGAGGACSSPWQNVIGAYAVTPLLDDMRMIAAFGNLLFVPDLNTSQLKCFQLNTSPMQPCAGFPVAANNWSLAPHLASSGVVDGVCGLPNENATLPFGVMPSQCWSFTGAALPAPQLPAGYDFPVSATAIPGTAKLLIGTWARAIVGVASIPGAAYCWDFATQGPCAGFTDATGTPGLRKWANANQATGPSGGVVVVAPASTKDYGYSISSGCAYGLGDGGVLWSFDPKTGNSPCVGAKVLFTQATPAAQYCDGSTHVSAWDKVSVAGLPTTLYGVTATVTDAASGAVLISATALSVVAGKATLDLSAISYLAHPSLNISLDVSASSAPASSQLVATVAFVSDRADQDVCYTAAVPSQCGAHDIVGNDAKLQDATGTTLAIAAAPIGGGPAAQVACQGPQIDIAKAASRNTYLKGVNNGLTYSIRVTNASTVATASSINVADVVPAGATLNSWTCATCVPASGGPGTIATTIPTLAPGAYTDITVAATILATASGTVSNTATVSPPANGTCVTCSSTATVNEQPGAILAVTKSTPTATYQNGVAYPVQWTITVSNTSAVASVGTVITDGVAPNLTLTSWTCTGCVTTSGTGPVNTTANIAANSSVTVIVNSTVASTATGPVTNTANITPALPDTCTTCSASAAVLPAAVLSITKSTPTTLYTVGGSTSVVWTIVVSNASSVPSVNTTIADVAPPGVVFDAWSCSACTPSTGTGDVHTTANIKTPVTITVNATIGPAVRGALLNAASITPVAPDSCVICSATSTVKPNAQLSVTKSVNITGYAVGVNNNAVWTITVRNSSDTPSTNTAITDLAPNGVTFGTWTCTGCAVASGSGNIQTTANVPANGTVTLTVNSTIAASAVNAVRNTVNITPAAPDACVTCSANATVPPLVNVPTLETRVLALLAAFVLIVGLLPLLRSRLTKHSP